MTPKERAAMQQALEAIGNTVNQALATIREALAEPQTTTPDVCGEVCARAKLCYGCNKDLEEANAKYVEQAEQEPYAYEVWDVQDQSFTMIYATQLKEFHWIEPENIARVLYAAPVRTKDLTDDELRQVLDRNCGDGLMAIARAVIAADRKLNGVEK